MSGNQSKPKNSRDNGRARRKDAFKRLKMLKCYAELHEKICADVAVEEVARWVQEDEMEALEVKRDTLIRQLYRYKADLPPGSVVKEKPLHVKRAIEKLKRGVNELEEMEGLYLLQLKRISIDTQTEEKINKLFRSTGSEINLAVSILNRMIEKKAELGILDKAPQKFDIQGGIGLLNMDGNEEMDDEKKTRLGLAAKAVLDGIISSKAKEKESTEDNHEMDDSE